MLSSFLRGIMMSNKTVNYLGIDGEKKALELISSNPFKLRSIDIDVLTEYPHIVETAIAFNIASGAQIPQEFVKKCPDVMSRLIMSHPEILKYLTLPTLDAHKVDIVALINTYPKAVGYIDDLYFKDHPDIIDDLLKQNGYNVQYLSSKIQISIPTEIEKMLKECPFAVQNLSPYFMRKYPDIITRTLKRHPGAAACIHPDYIDEHSEWAVIALNIDPGFISCVSVTFVKSHQPLIKKLIESNHQLLSKIVDKGLFKTIANELCIKTKLNRNQKINGHIF